MVNVQNKDKSKRANKWHFVLRNGIDWEMMHYSMIQSHDLEAVAAAVDEIVALRSSTSSHPLINVHVQGLLTHDAVSVSRFMIYFSGAGKV